MRSTGHSASTPVAGSSPDIPRFPNPSRRYSLRSNLQEEEEIVPRAGGVRTPGAASLEASVPEACRNSRHSPHSGVRFWQHEVEVAPVVEESLQTAEDFRQHRKHPSLVAHHRGSYQRGCGSTGYRSPQLCRGETIEETLSQVSSPYRPSPPLPHDMFYSLGDYGNICPSRLSPRHSDALPVFCQGLAGVPSTSWIYPDDHQVSSGGGPFAHRKELDNTLGEQGRNVEHMFTKKQLLDRMDNMERRIYNMETSVLQALERIETRQGHMEQALSNLQMRQNEQQGCTFSPTVSSTRVDVSLPRDDTREPSRAVDA